MSVDDPWPACLAATQRPRRPWKLSAWYRIWLDQPSCTQRDVGEAYFGVSWRVQDNRYSASVVVTCGCFARVHESPIANIFATTLAKCDGRVARGMTLSCVGLRRLFVCPRASTPNRYPCALTILPLLSIGGLIAVIFAIALAQIRYDVLRNSWISASARPTLMYEGGRECSQGCIALFSPNYLSYGRLEIP